MDDQTREQIERVIREIVGPLVRTDGGEVHLVGFEGDEVHLHLSGSCAGCPGASLTTTKMIQPALRAAFAKVRVVLTTGVRAPDGARRL